MPADDDEAYWTATHHELSFAMAPGQFSRSGWSSHTRQEAQIPIALSDHMRLALARDDCPLFLKTFARANGEATHGTGMFRSGGSGTQGEDGSMVLFPSVQRVQPRLAALQAFLSQSELPAFAKAVVAYCAVCNIHPFEDGNGRVARWLFSCVAQVNISERFKFLPIYEYFQRSHGAFLIRLRLAELRGDWNSLAGYLAHIVNTMAACKQT